MTKLEDNCTLVVKHLPLDLSHQDREELLTHFGATRVRCMSDGGQMKRTAFATFPTPQHARAALARLHQLEILGCVLSAEFAKPSQSRHFPLVSDFKNFQEMGAHPKEGHETKDLSRKLEDFTRRLHEIGPDIGLNYLPSPLLRYSYPSPTSAILANISHALAAVPKFYTQVLHLMNKMNLPSPFGLPVTPAPPLPPDPEPELQPPPASAAVVSSSSESELESDQEGQPAVGAPQPPRRPPAPRVIRPPPLKKPRLEQMLSAPTIPALTEPPASTPKKISIITPSAISTEALPAETSSVVWEEGGFGTLAPTATEPARSPPPDSTMVDLTPSSFIPLEDLEANKIQPDEMKRLSAFRNYRPGPSSTRLYLKNLSKHVTEKDLYRIFGQFIDQTSEAEKEIFNIVLMKEGRMKGQAFITLASEEQTQKAIQHANGYKIYDKPMVVQFARSQKKDAATS